ncbi:MAG: AAA family ATPase [Phycisphaerae bacterium]
MPPAVDDRLYLVNAAGRPEFRGIFDLLSSMGFYNMNPQAMKELQSPDAGELLRRDGGNLASVIARLGADNPSIKSRIKDYLSTIVPGVTEVDRIALGPRETLEFRQKVVGSQHPWRFYAASMSDGTLRALGALVAVTQLADRKQPVSLVGIEEPEAALHPAASGALMDALREAASHTQVVVTTHSPDLLEQIDPDSDRLLVVVSRDGDTRIAPVDSASRKVLKDHLYTPGELLRMDQLEPDEEDLERQQQQLRLFDSDGEDR